jgi:REP element-mobilizing transposase RayT
MNQHSEITAGRDLTTFRRSHAVRHPDCDYAGEIDVHLTLCAATGRPFERLDLAQFVCGTVEKTSTLLAFRLYGYCLMPDHLHVLLSPAESRVPVGTWLREFKSFTTRRQQLQSGEAELWQRSAHDHVCRTEETAEKVLAYIVNNPVRAGLVERWQDWAWTKVFIAV